MDNRLFQDQNASNNSQSIYYSLEKVKCSPGDLIMITNSNGKFLFDYFDNSCESPVFKVLTIRYDYGQVLLRLKVMQVFYPVPVFQHDNERLNMLQAIHQGLAVVQETSNIIEFHLERAYRIVDIELREVSTITPILVQNVVRVSGDCESRVSGQVLSQGEVVNSNQYFVTTSPAFGYVDLQEATGEWIYDTHRAELTKDCFEITVWNGLGGYATQRIRIRCNCMEVSKVEVVNLPLPVVACHPLPITVIGTPDVTVEGIVEITIPEVVTVTGSVSIVNQPIDVSVVALPSLIDVTVVNLPSLTIDGCVCVTVKGSPTVNLAGQPIEVSVVNLPLVVTTEKDEMLDMNLAALSFTEILSSTMIAPGVSTIFLYDVSHSPEHTFFTHLRTITTGVSLSAFMVISPTTNYDYFYVTSVTDVLLGASHRNYPFVSFHWGKYIGVGFDNIGSTVAGVEVLAQSQGGPIYSATITY